MPLKKGSSQKTFNDLENELCVYYVQANDNLGIKQQD